MIIPVLDDSKERRIFSKYNILMNSYTKMGKKATKLINVIQQNFSLAKRSKRDFSIKNL